ncbi:hypothetical protein H9P43_008822 [Blastocladiella emersonii ATCC 22665]|nr:hypothetical protein H9P43_008822 [Blastocladiella emersonii ATCC 22665]
MKLNDLPQHIIEDLLMLVEKPRASVIASSSELVQAARTPRVHTIWTHCVIRRTAIPILAVSRCNCDFPCAESSLRTQLSVYLGSLFFGHRDSGFSHRLDPAPSVTHPFNSVIIERVVRAARHSASTGSPLAVQLDAYLATLDAFLASLRKSTVGSDVDSDLGSDLNDTEPGADLPAASGTSAATHPGSFDLAALWDCMEGLPARPRYCYIPYGVIALPVSFTLVPCGLFLAIFFLFAGDLKRMKPLLDALVAADPTILTLKRPVGTWMRFEIGQHIDCELIRYAPPASDPANHVTFPEYLATLAFLDWNVDVLDILVQPPYSIDGGSIFELAMRMPRTESDGFILENDPDGTFDRATGVLQWLLTHGWIDTELHVLCCALGDHLLVKHLLSTYYLNIASYLVDADRRKYIAGKLTPLILEHRDLELLTAAVDVGTVSDDMWALLLGEIDNDEWRRSVAYYAKAPSVVKDWYAVIKGALAARACSAEKFAGLLELACLVSPFPLSFITYTELKMALVSESLLPALRLFFDRGLVYPNALALLAHIVEFDANECQLNYMKQATASLLSFAINDYRMTEMTLSYVGTKDVAGFLMDLACLDQPNHLLNAHHVACTVPTHPCAPPGTKPWHFAAGLIRERCGGQK